MLVVPALASLLAGLEGRIIFHAFGEYLRLQPPWSYVAVTVALYGVGLLFFLHYAGEHSCSYIFQVCGWGGGCAGWAGVGRGFRFAALHFLHCHISGQSSGRTLSSSVLMTICTCP